MVQPEPEPTPIAPPAASPEPSPPAATTISATNVLPSAAANAHSKVASTTSPQPYAAAAAPQLRAAAGPASTTSGASTAFVAPAAALNPRALAGDSTADSDDSATDETIPGPTGDRAVAQKMVSLARNKLKARDAAGAAALMLRLVTNDPEDHHAMEVLVRAWIAMGRGEDAVGYAELIVKKRPRRAAYRVLEGDARLSAGDAAGAQVAWRVALQLEPDNVEAKRRLALQ
jgi:predicted Zn-dependent protease